MGGSRCARPTPDGRQGKGGGARKGRRKAQAATASGERGGIGVCDWVRPQGVCRRRSARGRGFLARARGCTCWRENACAKALTLSRPTHVPRSGYVPYRVRPTANGGARRPLRGGLPAAPRRTPRARAGREASLERRAATRIEWRSRATPVGGEERATPRAAPRRKEPLWQHAWRLRGALVQWERTAPGDAGRGSLRRPPRNSSMIRQFVTHAHGSFQWGTPARARAGGASSGWPARRARLPSACTAAGVFSLPRMSGGRILWR